MGIGALIGAHGGTGAGRAVALLGLVASLACARAEAPPVGPPQRIVALAPSIVETLFWLGLGDRVAGIGEYTEWPPEAAAKPRLGGLFDPRLETVVGLDPDLAILLPSEVELRGRLEGLGVEVLTVPSDTLANFEATALAIAERCGVAATGRELLAAWREGLSPEPVAGAPRTLLVLNRSPGRLGDLLVAGSPTYLDEMLVRLGAVNAISEAAVAYPQVGLETVLEMRPEVIFELQSATVDSRLLIADWSAFPGIPAVAQSCVQVIAGSHVLLPGPRLPRLQAELRQAIAACGDRS